MIWVRVFDCEMRRFAHKAACGTFDRFNISGRWQIFCIVNYGGAKSIDCKFIGEEFFTFAASETWNFAILSFDGGFFRIAAVNMKFCIGIDKLDKFAGTD